MSTRAAHTKTPETPRASAVVRKSREAAWELLPMWSICGPAGATGMAAEGLGGGQVEGARGAPAITRIPETLLICRGGGCEGGLKAKGQFPPGRGGVGQGSPEGGSARPCLLQCLLLSMAGASLHLATVPGTTSFRLWVHLSLLPWGFRSVSPLLWPQAVLGAIYARGPGFFLPGGWTSVACVLETSLCFPLLYNKLHL